MYMGFATRLRQVHIPTSASNLMRRVQRRDSYVRPKLAHGEAPIFRGVYVVRRNVLLVLTEKLIQICSRNNTRVLLVELSNLRIELGNAACVCRVPGPRDCRYYRDFSGG